MLTARVAFNHIINCEPLGYQHAFRILGEMPCTQKWKKWELVPWEVSYKARFPKSQGHASKMVNMSCDCGHCCSILGLSEEYFFVLIWKVPGTFRERLKAPNYREQPPWICTVCTLVCH